MTLPAKFTGFALLFAAACGVAPAQNPKPYPKMIEETRLTLPGILRGKGYATALFGKWHVGLTFLDSSGYPILDEHARKSPEKPFFLFHSTQAVHLPSLPGKVFQGKTKAGPHGDFIAQFDHIVGALMEKLDALGLAEYILHQTWTLQLAIRKGEWKYLDHKDSGGNNYQNRPELAPYIIPDTAPDAPELYNLTKDSGETRNLFHKHPEIVAELKALLEKSKASRRSAPPR